MTDLTTKSTCCAPSCCSDAGGVITPPTVTDTVREKYAAVASSGLTNDTAGVRAVAEAFGYSFDELASIPAGANMGLSCGNPTATASLRPGEVVVDLGCGGGLDVLLAARAVGPTGRAIGIDMTPAMIDRARRNAADAPNVEFHLAGVDDLPIADASVDCVISNCVINLAEDKAAVFAEVFRILKPGGRVAVSDIALRRELPDELADSVAAYVGCIAGAVPIAENERLMREAGFADVRVIDSGADLNAYAAVEGQGACCSPAMEPATGQATGLGLPIAGGGCCSPGEKGDESSVGVHAGLAALMRRYDVNDYAASVKLFAVKP